MNDIQLTTPAQPQNAKLTNRTNNAAAQLPKQAAPAPEKKITTKKVDIVIAGNTYTINCPIDEENALHEAADYIHQFILELRKDAPHLSHEDLLVLCCLNLYEKIQEQKTINQQQQKEQQSASTILEKIIKDAKNILTDK